MPSTAKFGLRSPAGTDPPQGNTDIQHLAEDIENLALPVFSSTPSSTILSGREAMDSDNFESFVGNGSQLQSLFLPDLADTGLWKEVPVPSKAGFTFHFQNVSNLKWFGNYGSIAANIENFQGPGQSGAGASNAKFRLNSADYAMSPRTLQFRLRALVCTNDTPIGTSVTLALYNVIIGPQTSPASQGSGYLFTSGAALTGSGLTISSPGANLAGVVYDGSPFTIAAGANVLAIVGTAPVAFATNSVMIAQVSLQMRYI